jgi:hypothetical protein
MWVRKISVVALATTLLGLASDPLAAQSVTATGISRDFNPALSLNALLLYRSGLEAPATTEHAHDAPRDGFSVQELELQLTSSVDPYVKANFILAMHGTDGIELEEGIAQALFLPKGLGLRAGKLYLEFGKHNVYHTHQYPFVERPYGWELLLGDHGLNGAAIEASWLTPLPWYAEVIAAAFPLTESIYGNDDIPRNTWGGGARLRQLWDVSDRATFDVGVSYVGGDAVSHPAGAPDSLLEEKMRHFLGVDLTYKWNGRGAHPKSLELQAEWLRRGDGGLDGRREDGWYVHALARVTRRVVLGARVDTARSTDLDNVRTYTATLAFVPSEFQAIRLDGLTRDFGGREDPGLRVQYNLTIGSHPAHRY